MPTKFQLITELYDQTVQSVTGSYQSWTGFRLLEEQRKPLYQERRNTSDEEAQAKYSAEIQQQTAALREKRGELRLCRRIQSDIPRVSQQCQQAQAERQENLKKKEEHEHEYQR